MSQNNESDNNIVDWKSLLTAVMTAGFVSLISTIWFFGGLENRVGHLEKNSAKIEAVDDKLNVLNQQMASISTDLNYIRENINNLNKNSQALSGDVRELKIKMSLVEQNKAGR